MAATYTVPTSSRTVVAAKIRGEMLAEHVAVDGMEGTDLLVADGSRHSRADANLDCYGRLAASYVAQTCPRQRLS